MVLNLRKPCRVRLLSAVLAIQALRNASDPAVIRQSIESRLSALSRSHDLLTRESWKRAGLHDVVRERWPSERIFTYWDYRAGMFHQDLGMRIDLILAGGPVAERVRAAWVDRHARKGSGPSDHAPVIVDLDEAPDGDIGPVVPPPSRPVTKRGAKKLPQA